MERTVRVHKRKKQEGFTLIEVIMVIAIAGILVAIAIPSLNGWRRSQLASATTDLLADLQTVRLSAMTESSNLATRGFGLRFLDNASYQIFEFVDNGVSNFNYEGAAEEVGGYTNTLPGEITVARGTATPLISLNGGVDEAVLIYDKRGTSRTFNWSSVANRTYVLRHNRLAEARCVTISPVRIREGMWDAGNCIIR